MKLNILFTKVTAACKSSDYNIHISPLLAEGINARIIAYNRYDWISLRTIL